MNDVENFLIITINYNNKPSVIKSNVLKTLKEIKDETKNNLNLQFNENVMKFTLANNENIIISSDDDIIKYSDNSDPDKLKLKLNLSIDKNKIKTDIEENNNKQKAINNQNELKNEEEKEKYDKIIQNINSLESVVPKITEKNNFYETKIIENKSLIDVLTKSNKDIIEEINKMYIRIKSLEDENTKLKKVILELNKNIENLIKELQNIQTNTKISGVPKLNLNQDNPQFKNENSKVGKYSRDDTNNEENYFNDYDNKCKTERIDKNNINKFRKDFLDDTTIFLDEEIKEKIKVNNGDNHLAIMDLMLDINRIIDPNQNNK